MKDKYVPPGAYNGFHRPHKAKRPAASKLVALLSLISKNESVVDIGCGSSFYARELSKCGYKSFGIDGNPIHQSELGIIEWCDLTADCSKFFQCADWGIFFEVGEHIPKKFECVLFDNVSRIPKKGLVVTWAHFGVGIGRHRHVNCRTQVYVASEFARRGWFVDDEKTLKMRQLVRPRVELRQRIMVLRK